MGKGAVEKRVSVAYRVILYDSYDVFISISEQRSSPEISCILYSLYIRIAIFGILPYRGLYDIKLMSI